jgi:hypothetical protein
MTAYSARRWTVLGTLASLACFLISAIWIRLSTFPPSLNYPVAGISGVMLMGCLLINLFWTWFLRKGAWFLHLGLALVVAAVLFVFIPLFLKLTRRPPHEWFFQSGHTQYEVMVRTVILNKTKLQSWNTSLEGIVGRSGVYGKTNADGSLTVDFQGVGNWRVGGYLYHSGTEMVLKPGTSNVYFLRENPLRYYSHLTNDWYAYQ